MDLNFECRSHSTFPRTVFTPSGRNFFFFNTALLYIVFHFYVAIATAVHARQSKTFTFSNVVSRYNNIEVVFFFFFLQTDRGPTITSNWIRKRRIIIRARSIDARRTTD